MKEKPAAGRSASESIAADRERILAGARQHFFTHGFRSVTMADLAGELAMSKKTLYVYFASKAALLEAVIDERLARIEAAVTAVTEAPDVPFAERLKRLMATVRAQSGEIQPAFLRDVQREAPALLARARTGRRKIIEQCFGTLLEEGRKAGAVRRDIPVKLMIEMLIGTVDSVVVPARIEELRLPPQTVVTQIVAVFLEGVLIRKERAK